MSKLEALQDGIRKGVKLKEIERLYTAVILERNGGNKVHAADQLGIDRRTIQRWKIDGGDKNPGRTKPQEPPQNPDAE